MWVNRKTWYELFINGLVKDTLPCKYCGSYPKQKKVKNKYVKIPLYILKCNCKRKPSTLVLSNLDHVTKEWNREHT